MRSSLLWLAAAQLALCNPLDLELQAKTAPVGCRRLSKDTDWPSPEIWKAAMPNVVAIKPVSGKTAPDYRLQARSIADVQAAVKFATSNNIRVVSRFIIRMIILH